MGDTVSVGANQQMLRLSALLQVQLQARAAKRDELGFLMVNETISTVP